MTGGNDKVARREAQMKAAQDREKSWDKRVASSRSQRSKTGEGSTKTTTVSDVNDLGLSDETMRSIEKTKQLERQVAAVSIQSFNHVL